MPRRSVSIAPTVMPCWDWGTSRRRAKSRQRRSAITSRRCAWIAVIIWRCAVWPTSIAPESPEKASAWIAGLPPAQRRSIDDIERSLTNDRLEKQAQALESQGNWAQAAEVQRRRLALDSGQRVDNLPSGARSG
ncbi:cellulose synthase operon protein C [Klebsiella aerogenes]|nr:cellulose synthase operon protein C [Klebsiella aerogenes]